MSMSGKCPLVDRLPVELRLQIYDYIYTERYTCTLMLRADDKVEMLSQPSRTPQRPTALSQTCKTIYAETIGFVYMMTTFCLQLYTYRQHIPCSLYGLGLVTPSNLLFGRMKNLEIGGCLTRLAQVPSFMRDLETLADALEGAGAELETLKVSIRVFPTAPEWADRVDEDYVNATCEDALEHVEEPSKRAPSGTYRRILEAATVTSIGVETSGWRLGSLIHRRPMDVV